MSHPQHLMDPWSSALIPFCAYKTNLNFSRNSEVLPGITFPPCSSFLPTILGGQRCYKLNVNDTSGQGKTAELMLLLDYNQDRSLSPHTTDEDKSGNYSKDTLNFGINADI